MKPTPRQLGILMVVSLVLPFVISMLALAPGSLSVYIAEFGSSALSRLLFGIVVYGFWTSIGPPGPRRLSLIALVLATLNFLLFVARTAVYATHRIAADATMLGLTPDAQYNVLGFMGSLAAVLLMVSLLWSRHVPAWMPALLLLSVAVGLPARLFGRAASFAAFEAGGWAWLSSNSAGILSVVSWLAIAVWLIRRGGSSRIKVTEAAMRG